MHAYRDGRAPGLDRVRTLGVDAGRLPGHRHQRGRRDAARRRQGRLAIVAVGTHVTLVEFLDKGRSGMASTFLTRLRVGGKLVDAKGVSRLYRSRISSPADPAADRWPALAGAVSTAAWPPTTGRGARILDVISWGDWWDASWIAGLRRDGSDVIDFRYHLSRSSRSSSPSPSASSLGAGPLKAPIATADQAGEGAAQEKQGLRRLDRRPAAAVQRRDTFITGVATALTHGLLGGRAVVLRHPARGRRTSGVNSRPRPRSPPAPR